MYSYREKEIHRDRQMLFDRVGRFYQSDIPEDVLVLRLVARLGPFFSIDREVRSYDGKSRIDLICVHKDDSEALYPFGIECKRLAKKKGREIGDWLLQAVRYSESEFIGYGKVIPLVFPQQSGLSFDEGLLVHNHKLLWSDAAGAATHNWSTFLSSFGIGEVQMVMTQPWIDVPPEEKGMLGLQFVYGGQILWATDREYGKYGKKESALNAAACGEVVRRLKKRSAA